MHCRRCECVGHAIMCGYVGSPPSRLSRARSVPASMAARTHCVQHSSTACACIRMRDAAVRPPCWGRRVHAHARIIRVAACTHARARGAVPANITASSVAGAGVGLRARVRAAGSYRRPGAGQDSGNVRLIRRGYSTGVGGAGFACCGRVPVARCANRLLQRRGRDAGSRTDGASSWSHRASPRPLI